MQSVPVVVVGGVVTTLIATTERALRVGVGIAWTICPPAFGSSDILVVSQFAVFWVISTTTQDQAVVVPPETVLIGHGIGRASRDNTVPQLPLPPLVGMRHTLLVGIVKPFKEA